MLYIYLALFSALGFSLSDLCSKYLLDNGISNLQFLFYSHGVIFVTLCILGILLVSFFSKGLLTNNKKYLNVIKFPMDKRGLILICSSTLSFLALISLIYSFKISYNIGYTSAIVSTTSLFTLFISWIVLGKKINIVGLLGVLLIIIGVLLISRYNNKME